MYILYSTYIVFSITNYLVYFYNCTIYAQTNTLFIQCRAYLVARIISAHFSAIIMMGAAVFPEVMVGITDPSAMRIFLHPITCSWGFTTALSSDSSPILHVPTGWKIVVPMSMNEVSYIGIY